MGQMIFYTWCWRESRKNRKFIGHICLSKSLGIVLVKDKLDQWWKKEHLEKLSFYLSFWYKMPSSNVLVFILFVWGGLAVTVFYLHFYCFAYLLLYTLQFYESTTMKSMYFIVRYWFDFLLLKKIQIVFIITSYYK